MERTGLSWCFNYSFELWIVEMLFNRMCLCIVPITNIPFLQEQSVLYDACYPGLIAKCLLHCMLGTFCFLTASFPLIFKLPNTCLTVFVFLNYFEQQGACWDHLTAASELQTLVNRVFSRTSSLADYYYRQRKVTCCNLKIWPNLVIL